jgi:hypothetical protein
MPEPGAPIPTSEAEALIKEWKYCSRKRSDIDKLLTLAREGVDSRERIAALESDARTVAHLRNVRDRVVAGKANGAELSDAEVAGRIRMMTRDDLDHEMVCVMARDRIIELSDRIACLAGTPDAASRSIAATSSDLKKDNA